MPFSNSMLKILFNHNSFLMSNNAVSLSCWGCFVIKEPVNCISIQLTQWSTCNYSNLPQNAISRPWLRSGAVLWRLLNLFVWLNVVSWHASVYSPETIDICDVRQVFLSVSDIDDKPKRLFRVIPCPCEVPNDIFRLGLEGSSQNFFLFFCLVQSPHTVHVLIPMWKHNFIRISFVSWFRN